MKLATRLLSPVNTTVISILGVGQLLMGLWLVLPFNSLMLYSLSFPPEWMIGIVLSAIGATTARFSIRSNLKYLQTATTVAYIFWFIAMIFMVITAYFSIGWIVGLIFATYCFMINLNIRVNRRDIR